MISISTKSIQKQALKLKSLFRMFLVHKLLQEVIALKAYEKSLTRIEIQKKLKQL